MAVDLSLTLNQKVIQGKGNIVSNMDGEKVMLSIEQGKYYNLGEIGGEIWDLIDEKVTISQIVTSLMSKYEVEQSECEKQVITFLDSLLEEKLIELF